MCRREVEDHVPPCAANQKDLRTTPQGGVISLPRSAEDQAEAALPAYPHIQQEET